MAYWLVKSEPDVFSIDDLKREKHTLWDGVRNYQARNNLKSMKTGDEVLFYHSSCDHVGVAGLARVRKEAQPDKLQFDPKSDYYDASASKENPRWFSPELEFVDRFPGVLSLSSLKKNRGLEKMQLLQKGSRLSVQTVTEKEYKLITDLAETQTASE